MVKVLNFPMSKYIPSRLRESLIASGFDADDLNREFVIPTAVLAVVGAAATNVAMAAVSHELSHHIPHEAACVSVDKPTLVKPEETGNHCTQSPEDVRSLLDTAMAVHSDLSQVLVEACAFEAVTVDRQTNRVKEMDMNLKAPHFIQYPDNSWSVTVDGFVQLSEGRELDGVTFDAGSYVSFFQPKSNDSMDCADKALPYVENASFDLYDPMKVICRTHLDNFGTFNGNAEGNVNGVVMPVVSCGMLGVPNPRDIEGADKEDGHYSHTKTMSL